MLKFFITASSILCWFAIYYRAAYVSFGGLLMRLQGDANNLHEFEMDSHVYLFMKKLAFWLLQFMLLLLSNQWCSTIFTSHCVSYLMSWMNASSYAWSASLFLQPVFDGRVKCDTKLTKAQRWLVKRLLILFECFRVFCFRFVDVLWVFAHSRLAEKESERSPVRIGLHGKAHNS